MTDQAFYGFLNYFSSTHTLLTTTHHLEYNVQENIEQSLPHGSGAKYCRIINCSAIFSHRTLNNIAEYFVLQYFHMEPWINQQWFSPTSYSRQFRIQHCVKDTVMQLSTPCVRNLSPVNHSTLNPTPRLAPPHTESKYLNISLLQNLNITHEEISNINKKDNIFLISKISLPLCIFSLN